MKTRSVVRMVQLLAVIFASTMMFTGCEDEDTPDTGSLDSWFENHPYVSDPRTGQRPRDLSVTPESVEITFIGQQVNFRVAGGRSPYKWDVAIPTAGSIRRLAPEEAVYTATALAPNTVIVYDSRGQAGIADVNGAAPVTEKLTATAVPETITQVGGRSVLTASGGTPPYRWTVSDNALGSLADGVDTGQSVVYVASTLGSGDNSVRCTDSSGQSASVVIMQP